MNKTDISITPGGTSASQKNPSFSKVGPTDSGEGQTLQNIISNDPAMDLEYSKNTPTENNTFTEGFLNDPFRKRQKLLKSPTLSRSSSMSDFTDSANQKNVIRANFKKLITSYSIESGEAEKMLWSLHEELNSARIEIEDLKQELRNYKQRQSEIKSMESQMEMANKEVKELKKKMEHLQPKPKSSIPNTSSNYYDTLGSDEEEDLVARETEWMLPRTSKRRRSQEDRSPLGKSKNASKNVSIVPKNNTKGNTERPKSNNPPPVILSNMENYNVINGPLHSRNIEYKTNLLNNNQLKINANSDNDYRELTKYLNEAKLEWHTYENKQTRPIRVMARNLHHSCNPEDIKAELLSNGFKIIDVVNKIRKANVQGKVTRQPLSLFLLTFEHDENIKKIFEIKYICHMGVKMEALKNSKLIPQCKRCQRYEHTQRFCQRDPICVKCAGKHLSADCTKSRDIAAKCFNCTQEHPANYRGCTIAKELQRRRNLLIKPTQLNRQSQHTKPTSQEVTKELSYAQVAKTGKSNQAPPETNAQMMQMMQNMLNMMIKLSERLENVEASTNKKR